MIIRILLLSCLIWLHGCNTQAVKPQKRVELGLGAKHFQIAQFSFEQARNTADTRLLAFSVEHYQKAALYYSDNVFVQKNHYLARFMHDYIIHQSPSETLISQFEQLNPVIKPDLKPPSYIYYLGHTDKLGLDSQALSLLKTAINDNPYNASMWYQLSIHHREQEQPELATFAAQRAFELAVQNPTYQQQLALSLDDVNDKSHCAFENQALLSASARYFASSAQQQADQLSFDNAGLQFLRLGLFPLAYEYANEAYRLEKNHWTITHYLEASLALKRYQEAEQAMLSYQQYVNDAKLTEEAAMIAFAQANPSQAALLMKQQRQSWNNILVELRTRWIHALSNHAYEHQSLYSITPRNSWEGTVREFFEPKKGLTVPADYLLKQASNGCEKTEAHFYTAYKLWSEGDLQSARIHLKKTLGESATLYYEYKWARIFEDRL
jgi:tetratricopeptide (TPR) repeat protein